MKGLDRLNSPNKTHFMVEIAPTIYETPGMGRNRIGKEKTITIYYKFVSTIQ